MKKILGTYKNGTYNVVLFNEGTKIRMSNNGEFRAEFPESMDMKITNYCSEGCAYCHEMSNTCGKHGNINAEFLNTLKPFTEVAIGGGNPLEHPQIVELLTKFKENNVMASMTVNQRTLLRQEQMDLLRRLVNEGLLNGVGISVYKVDEHLFNIVDTIPNTVIHIINGVTELDDIRKLYSKTRKVLLLGYKQFTGRGVGYYEANNNDIERVKEDVKNNLKEIIDNFGVVSFDNKAILQLDVKSHMSEDEWNSFYMGNDGEFTLYVDLVKEDFALSSVSVERHSLNDYNNIIDMFEKVRTN